MYGIRLLAGWGLAWRDPDPALGAAPAPSLQASPRRTATISPVSRIALTAVGLVILGLLLGIASAILAGFSEVWRVDALLGVGTALLLFLPLYFYGRMLDQQIVETRQQIGEIERTATVLDARVTDLQESVDQRLDEVREIVYQRLSAERTRDEEVLRDLSAVGSRELLEEAMTRAEELDVINPVLRSPRVSISDSEHLYLAVVRPTEDEQRLHGRDSLELDLATLEGRVLATVPWPTDATTEEVMVQMGRHLRARTREDLDPQAFFQGLSDLLLAGLHNPARCPVVQLVPPQWIVTAKGTAVPYRDGSSSYAVSARQLRAQPGFEWHVKQKTWVDGDCFDEAVHVLLALFPESTDRVGF